MEARVSRAGCQQHSPPPSLSIAVPRVPGYPGLPWIQRLVGRGSCPNSPHPSDRTQLSRGGEGTLDKTVKQRLGFVYLVCLTQFPGPRGTGSELGDGVRKGAWFPSLSWRLSQSFLDPWPSHWGHPSTSSDSAGDRPEVRMLIECLCVTLHKSSHLSETQFSPLMRTSHQLEFNSRV